MLALRVTRELRRPASSRLGALVPRVARWLTSEAEPATAKAAAKAKTAEPWVVAFDTEYSALAKGFPKTQRDFEQAKIRTASIGWALFDRSGAMMPGYPMHRLVKPIEGFPITEEATAIHGITHAQAEAEGVPADEALDEFARDVLRVQANGGFAVGHNVGGDRALVFNEVARARGALEGPETARVRSMMEACSALQERTACTLSASAEINTESAGKWMKLGSMFTEVVGRLAGTERTLGLSTDEAAELVRKAHTASEDAVMSGYSFIGLERLGHNLEAMVITPESTALLDPLAPPTKAAAAAPPGAVLGQEEPGMPEISLPVMQAQLPDETAVANSKPVLMAVGVSPSNLRGFESSRLKLQNQGSRPAVITWALFNAEGSVVSGYPCWTYCKPLPDDQPQTLGPFAGVTAESVAQSGKSLEDSLRDWLRDVRLVKDNAGVFASHTPAMDMVVLDLAVEAVRPGLAEHESKAWRELQDYAMQHTHDNSAGSKQLGSGKTMVRHALLDLLRSEQAEAINKSGLQGLARDAPGFDAALAGMNYLGLVAAGVSVPRLDAPRAATQSSPPLTSFSGPPILAIEVQTEKNDGFGTSQAFFRDVGARVCAVAYCLVSEQGDLLEQPRLLMLADRELSNSALMGAESGTPGLTVSQALAELGAVARGVRQAGGRLAMHTPARDVSLLFNEMELIEAHEATEEIEALEAAFASGCYNLAQGSKDLRDSQGRFMPRQALFNALEEKLNPDTVSEVGRVRGPQRSAAQTALSLVGLEAAGVQTPLHTQARAKPAMASPGSGLGQAPDAAEVAKLGEAGVKAAPVKRLPNGAIATFEDGAWRDPDRGKLLLRDVIGERCVQAMLPVIADDQQVLSQKGGTGTMQQGVIVGTVPIVLLDNGWVTTGDAAPVEDLPESWFPSRRRVNLKFGDYDPQVNALIKAQLGARWDPSARLWHIELSKSSAAGAAEACWVNAMGHDLEVMHGIIKEKFPHLDVNWLLEEPVDLAESWRRLHRS